MPRLRPILCATVFAGGVLALFKQPVVLLARYVSLHRRSLGQQAAVEKERSRIARDLHDDLGSRLTKIILLNELTLQRHMKPDLVCRQMQQSLATARQMIKSLDETVWAVNPRNDTLPQLLNYTGDFAVEFLQTAGMRCRIDFPHHLPERIVSSEIRHHLFLAVKEALNNIVRHAQATKVTLRAVITDESLRLAIEDDGRGFDPSSDSPFADGMKNMRWRMDEIGGVFRVESSPGKGTVVSFVCRWKQPGN